MKRYTASDWCNPILARDDDQVRWLSQEKGALAVVNDEFLIGDVAMTPLSFAIRHASSLTRIQFLVEEARAIPTDNDIGEALRNYVAPPMNVLRYLHAKGARHVKFRKLESHLGFIFRQPKAELENEEEAVELLLYYPALIQEVLDHLHYDISRVDIYYVACHRKARARDAAATLILLKRLGIGHKDVMKLVAQKVMDPTCVSKREWGRFRGFSGIPRSFDGWLVILTCVFIILTGLIFIFLHFYNIPTKREDDIFAGKHWAGPTGPPGMCPQNNDAN